jgi:hypothetical protein
LVKEILKLVFSTKIQPSLLTSFDRVKVELILKKIFL